MRRLCRLDVGDAGAVGGRGGFGSGGDEVAEDTHTEVRGGVARRPGGGGRRGCLCGDGRYRSGLSAGPAGAGCV